MHNPDPPHRLSILHMLFAGAIECVSARMLVGVQQEAAPGVRGQAETHQKVRVLLNTTGALLSPVTVITQDKQSVLSTGKPTCAHDEPLRPSQIQQKHNKITPFRLEQNV